MTHDEARQLADKIIAKLKPFVERGHICGSYRRGKKDLKDIDLVVIPKVELIKDMFGTVTGKRPVQGFIDAVNSWEKFKGEPTGRYTERIVDGHKVEISMATPENWGCLKAIRTGSYEFNILIMQHIRKIGLEQRDGYLWKNGKIIPCFEEKDYFAAIGLPYVEPHQRDEHAFRRLNLGKIGHGV